MIDVTVDSGACVTVMPAGLCQGITIVENDLCKNGVEYEVANGESIENPEERRCEVMTIGSMIPKRIVIQIADVHKPLLSINAQTWATTATSAKKEEAFEIASRARSSF